MELSTHTSAPAECAACGEEEQARGVGVAFPALSSGHVEWRQGRWAARSTVAAGQDGIHVGSFAPWSSSMEWEGLGGGGGGRALTSQMARMSQICMRGLVGDSSMTSLVRPGTMAARTALPGREGRGARQGRDKSSQSSASVGGSAFWARAAGPRRKGSPQLAHTARAGRILRLD
jgi:hypothetical protein